MSNDQLKQVDAIINDMNNMNICGPECLKKKKLNSLRTQLNIHKNK